MPQEARDKVLAALADPRWDLRSIPGIARATGLSKQEVEEVIESNSDLIRRALLLDAQHRPLYTLRSRKPSWRERLDNLRAIWSRRLFTEETSVTPTEEAQDKVLDALADTRWDLSSIPGIARATGLSKQEVEGVLVQLATLLATFGAQLDTELAQVEERIDASREKTASSLKRIEVMLQRNRRS